MVGYARYGFIVMDGNGSLFGTLCGNTREVLHKFTVDLPKKHGRGGQSALRFARLRMEKRHNYVRKVRLHRLGEGSLCGRFWAPVRACAVHDKAVAQRCSAVGFAMHETAQKQLSTEQAYETLKGGMCHLYNPELGKMPALVEPLLFIAIPLCFPLLLC